MAKGYKTGGKQKGTMNKATRERLESERIARQAQEEVNKAADRKIKLGKDVLEDYMGAFHNVAAAYQNRIAVLLEKQRATSLTPDERTELRASLAEFKEWGSLTAETARKLADFQSPKFKAIAVMAPPPSLPKPVAGKNVIPLNDPVAAMRVYQNMLRVGKQ
jgi:hypothetical protein